MSVIDLILSTVYLWENRAGEFSYNIGFEQRFTDQDNLPTADDAFRLGQNLTSPDCSSSDPCYIVAGSNENDPVKASIVEGEAPDDIEGVADSTDNPSGDTLFQHYPTGRQAPYQVRNPFDVWYDKYGN